MRKSLLFLSLIASISTVNAQWTEQATGFSAASRGLSEIRAIDANTVWAFAYDGAPITTTHPAALNVQQYTRTTDGGTSWNAGDIELNDPALEINNISPVDGLTAWVSALVPADGGGVIYKTIDGGVSWDQQLPEGFGAAASFLNGVYFFNANVGIAYGDPINAGGSAPNGVFEVYRTTNGGDTWTLIPASSLPTTLVNEWGYNNAPIAVGNTLWFTTSKGRLIKTTDAGLTWTAQQTPIADFGGSVTTNTSGNAHFSNANIGCILRAVGTTSFVYTYYTTVDGGTTWSAGAAFTGTRRILNYIPGTTTLVGTSMAAPVGTSISTDNGLNWTEVEAADQRGVAAFLNGSTGWCGGFSEDVITGGVYKLTSPLAGPSVATSKFKVYPNPANSIVTISTPDVETATLSVMDLSGKTLMTKSLNGIENTVDISSLSTGAYFFEVNANNKKEVVKILKN